MTSKVNEATVRLLGKTPRPFDFLSSPDIRDTVVQKLGEDHGISIVVEPAMNFWTWQKDGEASDGNYYTYEEAVRAALLEVMGE